MSDHLYNSSFQKQILHKKSVGFSVIQTWIAGVDGKHADHFTTTTTSQVKAFLDKCFWESVW